MPKAKPDILYIGLNDRDAQMARFVRAHISSGEKKLLRKNTEKIAGWQFDDDGTLRLAERTNAGGDTEILRVDANGFKQIYGCSVLEELRRLGFDAATSRSTLRPTRATLDLAELETAGSRPRRLRPKSSAIRKKRVDIVDGKLSEIDHRMLFTDYEDDTVRRYFHDKVFEKDYHWLQSKLPGLEIDFGARLKG